MSENLLHCNISVCRLAIQPTFDPRQVDGNFSDWRLGDHAAGAGPEIVFTARPARLAPVACPSPTRDATCAVAPKRPSAF